MNARPFFFTTSITSSEDDILRHQLRLFYAEVQQAFASGDADKLTATFDSAISRPMKLAEIHAWALSFFTQHGSATFEIKQLHYEHLEKNAAVVAIKFRVITPSGEGSFSGVERDIFKRISDKWVISAWEKMEVLDARHDNSTDPLRLSL